MVFARKVWKLLVGIKDALALIFLLLFFFALFAVLTARPNPAQVREGALLLDLNGTVVEEKAAIDPLDLLLSGEDPMREFAARDLVHALDEAAKDERIKAVVLDLTQFVGGGQVHMQEIGAALDRVQAAKKPVLTYALGYGDDAMMLAAHASEVWVNPMGGAVIAGPGGKNLYYGKLLQDLDVNARVYKVGTYKSAVEPYIRNDMSPEARENAQALYGALWEEWQANVKKARPKIDLDKVTKTPVEWVEAAKGDLATAALQAGLVDKLGSRSAFGERVKEIVGEDAWDETPGAYAMTELEPYLADKPRSTQGDAIGVVTIAGTIVDGEVGPGTAGGERIANLLDEALDDDLKALVVRVDSPGGSVTASEDIREAILRHKAKGIPIVVSMANVAASGGYWVSTPADRIFAEPETITGSIGIFAVVPSFEKAGEKWGVSADGVSTTPLTGQPDFVGGFNPEVDAILQASIENGYDDFLTRVAKARKMDKARVDELGQGRVWDGGAARQVGLVDQYGGMDEALEWAAKQAKLGDGDWHAKYLGDGVPEFQTLIRQLMVNDSQTHTGGDLFAMLTTRQMAMFGQVERDLSHLLTTRGMQAYCLECPAVPRASVTASRSRRSAWRQSWLAKLLDAPKP